MFKVPDWDDSANNNLKFTNVPSKNNSRKKKTNTTEKQKHIVLTKPKFKAKVKTNSKLNSLDGFQKPNKSGKPLKAKKNNADIQEKYNIEKQNNHSAKVTDEDITISNYKSDELDGLILAVKRERLDTYKNDDNEDILFHESPKRAKIEMKSNIDTNLNSTPITSDEQVSSPRQEPNIVIATDSNKTENTKSCDLKVNIVEFHKKNALKQIFQSRRNRNTVNVNSGSRLRERMLDRLKAAKFRYLNEKLYTSSGSDAQKMFNADPIAFQTYHEGYQQQVKKWPVNPLDVIVKRIKNMPKTHQVADMGCGEAELAKRVVQSVRSFDLVSAAPDVEACDMARTPLLTATIDVTVYCLALMGTDLTRYLIEANRVLKVGGHLLIAEVESRFDNVDAFAKEVQRLGFSLKKLDKTQKVFFFLEFTKVREAPVKKGKLPVLTLKPCIYKKR